MQLLEHMSQFNPIYKPRFIFILWHVHPLLRNGGEISNYIAAGTRQLRVNSNRRTVFSARSVPRCYKKGKLVRSYWVGWLDGELENCWGSVIVTYCCEKLVVEEPLPSNGSEDVTVRTSVCA
jgi:hypothetical protein